VDFGNVLTAMVTPFDGEQNVDYGRAQALARYLVERGSDGLVVAGTTGESPTLKKDEKLELWRQVKAAVGPEAVVVAGSGTNSTEDTVELTRAAAKTGVDAVMLVGPSYNKPPQSGIFEHFRAGAAATDLPVIIYNVPGRTGKNISAATTLRCAREVPNIVAVKEASGDLIQVSEIAAGMPDDFSIYSGSDEFTLPILAVGGRGIISVVSHVVGPQMQEMVAAFRAGQTQCAAKLHQRLLPIFAACFLPTSCNPSCVKRALALCGFDTGGVRLPLKMPTEEDTGQIRQACEQVGIL
jgi:4-hydroxy-tetrahydrodipicolinate synthase